MILLFLLPGRIKKLGKRQKKYYFNSLFYQNKRHNKNEQYAPQTPRELLLSFCFHSSKSKASNTAANSYDSG